MPRRVVVVNDDLDMLDLFATVLAGDGYEVATVLVGSAALGSIRDNAPAMVILDIRLETPDQGWTILAEMQADPALAQIPVIVTTADAIALREHAAGVHGDRYTMLSRPFDIRDLSRLVRQLAGPPDAE
jgi:CheY-like chemotaxis protein